MHLLAVFTSFHRLHHIFDAATVSRRSASKQTPRREVRLILKERERKLTCRRDREPEAAQRRSTPHSGPSSADPAKQTNALT